MQVLSVEEKKKEPSHFFLSHTHIHTHFTLPTHIISLFIKACIKVDEKYTQNFNIIERLIGRQQQWQCSVLFSGLVCV